ncbi:MAG: POTRA domain-containing protein, partial [candidate division WOR-3 bacterium]
MKITYNGNKSIPSRELNQAILSRIKGEYSESILNQDVERIIRAYYNKGFFSPTVKTKTREISNGIEIIFDIKEGPRPKIKEIRIEDDQKDYPKDLLRLKLGDFFIQEGIRESQKKIENFYKEKGYAFA